MFFDLSLKSLQKLFLEGIQSQMSANKEPVLFFVF